jgi:NADPH:quinone reductase-like Zn-dependent oxidoreductase
MNDQECQMDTMKAVRAHRRGGPEQLVFEVAPRPEPGRGEALVAVHAASITPDELTWDATWTDGRGPGGRDRTPIVPSHEMSGVVAHLGPEVADVEVGDEVYCLIPFVRDGAAAEYVSVPADLLARKPVTIDHDTAASIPLAALTAWQALVDHAGLRADHQVLIHGGAGGVGSFAVQIAADLGARVTATAREGDRAFVQGLGATEFVDYEHDRFEDRVAAVDVVLDPVGGSTQARSWSVLRPGGVLVSIAVPPDPAEAAKHGARGVFFVVEPDRDRLERIAALVDSGRITPIVDRVVPLADTRAAYEGLRTEHRQGKVVLHVAG